jgi:hypothetical protein
MLRRMKKRVLAAVLWFYAGWYAGAIVADFLGIAPMFGPVLGAAAAALIAGDPRGIIWTKRSPQVQRRIDELAASSAPAPSH